MMVVVTKAGDAYRAGACATIIGALTIKVYCKTKYVTYKKGIVGASPGIMHALEDFIQGQSRSEDVVIAGKIVARVDKYGRINYKETYDVFNYDGCKYYLRNPSDWSDQFPCELYSSWEL